MEYYILSFLSTNSFLLLWFFSPLPNSIGKIFFKRDDIYILENLIDIISIRSQFLGTLLSCWICLSFWSSLFIGIIIMLFFDLPIYFPFICFVSNPPILFLIKQLYR